MLPGAAHRALPRSQAALALDSSLRPSPPAPGSPGPAPGLAFTSLPILRLSAQWSMYTPRQEDAQEVSRKFRSFVRQSRNSRHASVSRTQEPQHAQVGKRRAGGAPSSRAVARLVRALHPPAEEGLHEAEDAPTRRLRALAEGVPVLAEHLVGATCLARAQ